MFSLCEGLLVFKSHLKLSIFKVTSIYLTNTHLRINLLFGSGRFLTHALVRPKNIVLLASVWEKVTKRICVTFRLWRLALGFAKIEKTLCFQKEEHVTGDFPNGENEFQKHFFFPFDLLIFCLSAPYIAMLLLLLSYLFRIFAALLLHAWQG